MKRPAAFRFASGKNLLAYFGVAALALAPQIALAQHGAGGGHAGGGGGASAGGHASPGGGGGYSAPAAPHFSPPPAPPQTHNAPPPQPMSAPRFAPPPPQAAAMPHVVQPPAPTVYVPPPAAFNPPRGAPPTSAAIMPPNVPAAPTPANSGGNNAIMPPAPVTPAPPSPVNFPRGAGYAPSATATQPTQLFSTTPDAMRARTGQPLRFVGEGHQIYSEPVPAALNTPAASSTAGGSSTSVSARRPFPGPAGLASASATPGAPPHIFPPHRRVDPIIVNPGFGAIGFGGFGFGTPFFGSPFYFGNPYFFGDPFFGFEFGSVFVPCNGFGAGLQCMPYNSNYYFEQPFTSTMIGGTETQTQTQEIFSPYSPAPPSPEENNAPSPDEYVLYLKNGAVYVVSDYWYEDGKLVYSTSAGQDSVSLDQIDMQKTLDVNAKRGMVFTLRPTPTPPTDQNAPAPAPQP